MGLYAWSKKKQEKSLLSSTRPEVPSKKGKTKIL
jgi:hypothetical protein